EYVGHAGNHLVEPAAEVAGECTDGSTDERGSDHGEESDDHRGAGPPQRAGEDVIPLARRAERMPWAWRLVRFGDRSVPRVLAGKDLRERCDEEDEHDQQRCN